MTRLNKYFFLFALLALGCGTDEGMEPPTTTVSKISVEDISIEEGDDLNFVFVRLILDKPSTGNVTATISSFGVEAEAGTDFVAFENVPVVFEPGDLVAEYRMEVKGDEEPEPDETFEVRIVKIEGATILDDTGIVTLLNDEANTGEIDIPATGYSTPDSYPGMTKIWQDEFTGTAIDESNWTFEIGNGSSGWGNNELQYYRKDNAMIYDNNHLVIQAKNDPFNGFQYTSTRMITKDKFDFKYGRVDIRAVLPEGQGIWPALWMLGSNFQTVGWPACGEIDIMELVGNAPGKVHGTMHWRDSNGQHSQYGGDISLPSGKFSDEFHVFSIIWDSNSIRWLMDDQQYHVADTSPNSLSEFQGDFFFIFNVAVGGNWPGSPNSSTQFPQHMIVDYIRVFQ